MTTNTLMATHVSAVAAFDVSDILQKHDVDPKTVFKKIGIDIRATRDPNQRISLKSYTDLLHTAAREAKLPSLGLKLGSHQDPSKWGAFGYLVMNSQTVRAALQNLTTYIPAFQSGTHAEYFENDEALGLKYAIFDPHIEHKEQDAEFAIAYFQNIVERFCRQSVTPFEVHFEHAPLSQKHIYQQAFGQTPLFHQPSNLISYPKALATTPSISADPRLFALIKHYVADMLKSMPQEWDLIASLSYYIRQFLPLQECNLPRIAETLGIEPRTLQRQLAELNTSFSQILENVRREEAISYLTSSQMEIKEISYLLGYSDICVFTRSFKSWTGQTPTQYRVSHHR